MGSSGSEGVEVLIYRAPGTHAGDVRKMRHIIKPEIEALFQGVEPSRSTVIFFSTQGDRSAADMMADGDYDGDKCVRRRGRGTHTYHLKPRRMSNAVRPASQHGLRMTCAVCAHRYMVIADQTIVNCFLPADPYLEPKVSGQQRRMPKQHARANVTHSMHTPHVLPGPRKRTPYPCRRAARNPKGPRQSMASRQHSAASSARPT